MSLLGRALSGVRQFIFQHICNLQEGVPPCLSCPVLSPPHLCRQLVLAWDNLSLWYPDVHVYGISGQVSHLSCPAFLVFVLLTSWTNKNKRDHDHQIKHPWDFALAASLCTASLVCAGPWFTSTRKRVFHPSCRCKTQPVGHGTSCCLPDAVAHVALDPKT